MRVTVKENGNGRLLEGLAEANKDREAKELASRTTGTQGHVCSTPRGLRFSPTLCFDTQCTFWGR